MEEPEVTKSCLWSLFCWAGARKIKANDKKVARLYHGGQEIQATGDVKIDHVAAADVRFTDKAVVTATPPDFNEPAKLDTLVEIKDDKLPLILRDEVCSRVWQTAWYGFGAIKNARCRLALRGVMNMASTTAKVPIGEKDVKIDVGVNSGVFEANFIPDWQEFSQLAEQAVFKELQGEEFPMDSKLQ